MLILRTTPIALLYKKGLAEKTQFPKLHFGPGLFDLERSRVKGQFFFTDVAFTWKREISIGKGAMSLKCHCPRVTDH